MIFFGGDLITDKQYTVGEFAALNKITARMLRHYDKIGLLKPADILDNGYRVYTSAQIPMISKIRLYQSCQFSLSEIRELLRADENTVRQLAKEKIKQLRSQEKDEQLAWTELTRLSRDSLSAYENPYDISFVEQSAQTLFRCKNPVREEDLDSAIDSLYDTLSTMQVEPRGLLLLFSDLEDDFAGRIAVPVASWAENNHRDYECMQMESGWYLSTFHFGDYYSIGIGYDRLICYADEKSYTLNGPFMERYFIDEEHTLTPARYITQILVKIAP